MKKMHIILLISTLFSVQFVYAALRDPTRPPDYIESQTSGEGGKEAAESLELTQVIYSKDRKIAVIGGQAVKIGDEVMGDKVIDIGPNTVQLMGPDGKITLFLLDKSVKQLTSPSH